MSDIEEPEETIKSETWLPRAEYEQHVREWLGDTFPTANSFVTHKQVRRLRFIRWQVRGIFVLYCVCMFTSTLNPPSNFNSLGSCLTRVAVCLLMLFFLSVVERQQLRTLIKANDIYTIPVLLDYLKTKEPFEEKVPLVQYLRQTLSSNLVCGIVF